MTSVHQNVAPGPTSPLGLGNLVRIQKNPLDFFSQLAREHGAVARFKLGTRTFHLLTDPEHIKYVLQDNYRNFTKTWATYEDRSPKRVGPH